MKRINFDDIFFKIYDINDGNLGVEEFKIKNKVLSKKNINIIIMDLNMGKMNGDEASRIVIYIYKD